MNCGCGKKNCRCGGKSSKSVKGKYAEGGAVMPTTTNPATGKFAQGANKYLDMITQRRAAARSQMQSRNPADVVTKYFPPPAPEPTPAPAPTPAQPMVVRGGDNGADRRAERAMTPRTAGGFASSGMASRMPGGVNTRNPSSGFNQAAARMTSGPQKAPTKADRPKSRPR